jgi:hypothetical protein
MSGQKNSTKIKDIIPFMYMDAKMENHPIQLSLLYVDQPNHGLIDRNGHTNILFSNLL